MGQRTKSLCSQQVRRCFDVIALTIAGQNRLSAIVVRGALATGRTHLTAIACLACPGRMLPMLPVWMLTPDSCLANCNLDRALHRDACAEMTRSRAPCGVVAAAAAGTEDQLEILCRWWGRVGRSARTRQHRQDMPPLGM